MSASVFESFNARSLAPEQVAQTFVAPSSFIELVTRSHATIIGPRGSGKTSLLKMLQPRAIENWHARDAALFRSKIDYTAVFIPTDISWSRQTLAIVDGLPANLVQLFRTASFTTHVLHELMEVFCWRCDQQTPISANSFRRASIPLPKQREISTQLAHSWNLKPSTETFIGLKHALSARQSEIWSIIQRLALLPGQEKDIPTWVTLDLLSACGHAIELFDDAINDPGGRWALLFDELELAPEWIMKGLLTALRSTNPKLIFKLAISPFNESYEELKNALQAVPDQDYIEIKLWHAHKEDGLAFSRKLLLSICNDASLAINSPLELLGRSVLDADDEGPKAYSIGSIQHRALKRAQKSDISFKRYLLKNGIELGKIGQMSESERAAKIRKIYPIILIRNFFRAEDNTILRKQQDRKGRKSFEIYTGADSLLTIAEGNPRWIIGLTRSLLHETISTGKPVPRDVQARLVGETIHKFRARLKTVGISQNSTYSRASTLLGLLDKIGEYLRASVITDDFHPQPPLSFTVDASVSLEVTTAIGRALNSGALVYVPDKTAVGLLNDIKGKRFRLSYLLAPHYSLPLRLGSEISLAKILSTNSSESQQEFPLNE